MAKGYIDPADVRSPKRHWTLIDVLYDKDGAAVALGIWDDKPVLAMRWNGSAAEGNPLGNPQSRGLPTWFIVPDQFHDAILGTLPLAKQALVRTIAHKRPRTREG